MKLERKYDGVEERILIDGQNIQNLSFSDIDNAIKSLMGKVLRSNMECAPCMQSFVLSQLIEAYSEEEVYHGEGVFENSIDL